MRAIVQDRYGLPGSVLGLREVERPVPGRGEVLVRVRAASVHPDVWHAVTGRPWVGRSMGGGLWRPKWGIPGTDMAGVGEAVGEGASRFAPGEAVFGETFSEMAWRNGGTFAEYVAAPEAILAGKPSAVSFEEAATVPTSGFIAVNNLRAGGESLKGKRVLVNGAAGNLGSIFVQISS